MSTEQCPFGPIVIEATRNGHSSVDLRAHVAGCAECGEAARVSVWMGDVAARLSRTQTLPDPTYLWLRAEIERRTKETRAVSRLHVSLLALLSLSIGLPAAGALLAVLPRVSSAVSGALPVVAGVAPDYLTLIGTVWLGFPLLLMTAYLLVFRLPRT